MTPSRLLAAGAVTAVTLLSFYVFPGHAYLTSDTQIYAPILENLREPRLFTRDLVAQHPHVRLTLYDEITAALRLFGLSLQSALVLQQVITRWLGLLGVFLIARRLSLSMVQSTFVTATFALGAFVAGPAVFTLEVEPVPRGFAVGLMLFALGLIAWGHWLCAAFAAAVAALYHPAVTLPFWVVYAGAVGWPRRSVPKQAWIGLAVGTAAIVVLGGAAIAQPGLHESIGLFGSIPPDLEKLQKLRATYNWLTLWPKHFWWQYPILTALVVAAWWRLRRDMPQALSLFVLALPLLGLVCMPLSYWLLDVSKVMLLPQWQPARAVLFCTAFVMLFGSVAAVKAVEGRRYWESALWLTVIYALPMNTDLLEYVTAWEYNHIRLRAYLTLGLALAATASLFAAFRARVIGSAVCLAVAAFAFWVFPVWGLVKNYPSLETPELTQLAEFARTSSPVDSVFLFPKAKENQAPGVFRARALRAVYVDWKAGGQVNFSPAFAKEWWSRWQDTMSGAALKPLAEYRSRSIDYVVVGPGDAVPGSPQPVFRNARYAVYSTSSASTAARSGMED